MTIQQRDSDTYSICGRIDFGKPIFSRALHMLLHYLYISFYNLSLVFLSWTALHCHKNIDFRSTRKRASKCEYHDIGACNYNVIFWPLRISCSCVERPHSTGYIIQDYVRRFRSSRGMRDIYRARFLHYHPEEYLIRYPYAISHSQKMINVSKKKGGTD